MQIAIILDKYVPESGGGFTFQESILNELMATENGHSYSVFYRGRKSENTPSGNSRFQFIHLGKLFRIQNYLSKYFLPWRRSFIRFLNVFGIAGDAVAYSPFDKLARKHHVQLAWFTNPSYLNTDLPTLFTVWDLQHRLQPYFPEVSANGEWAWREAIYYTAVRRASYILTGTEAGQKEIARFYDIPDERIKIIPQPTPQFALDSKRKQISHQPTMKLPEKYIFYPAQFWAHKNHVNLLLALKYLSDHLGLKMNLVLVGKDYDTKKHVLKKITELGLQDQVHIFDFVSREDLIGLYQKAMALVYVTYFGPDNLPPLEAFALGCPVIASAVSGSKEQLGDCAILVDQGNPKEIATAIKKLHDDGQLRNQLIDKGYERAEQFTSKQYVEKVIQLVSDFEKIRNNWE